MQYCASGATETILAKFGPSIETGSQSAQKMAPGCVPDKLRIIDDAVRSGEPEHPPLLVPVKRQGLGASEARSGACGLPAFQNSRDDIRC